MSLACSTLTWIIPHLHQLSLLPLIPVHLDGSVDLDSYFLPQEPPCPCPPGLSASCLLVCLSGCRLTAPAVGQDGVFLPFAVPL